MSEEGEAMHLGKPDEFFCERTAREIDVQALGLLTGCEHQKDPHRKAPAPSDPQSGGRDS